LLPTEGKHQKVTHILGTIHLNFWGYADNQLSNTQRIQRILAKPWFG